MNNVEAGGWDVTNRGVEAGPRRSLLPGDPLTFLERGASFRGRWGNTLKLSQATPAIVHDAWTERASSISDRPWISEVARSVVDGLYERFEESLVLVRSFLTVPYQGLPGSQRAFAANLARSVQLEDSLAPHTPVFSLLATRGSVSEWNDPRESRGHVAIPLLSESFVKSCPMLSMLFKKLGMPLTWTQSYGANMQRWMTGYDVGLFFVEHPANAVNKLGRKIIPAQEFVAGHSVRSAFAVGGTIFGGAVFVLIFFGRDPVESRTARAFLPLVNQVKGTLISRCSMSRVFLPETPAGPDDGKAPGPPPAGGND